MQFEEFVKLWTPATTEESVGKREALALSSKSRKPSSPFRCHSTKKGSGVDDTSAGGTLEDASGGSFLLASASKSFKKRLSLGGDASEGKSFSMGKSFRKSFVQGISVLSALREKAADFRRVCTERRLKPSPRPIAGALPLRRRLVRQALRHVGA